MKEPLGIILAGGRGTRMGSVSKAKLMLGHTALLDRAIDRLTPQVCEVVVNANDIIETSLPIIEDSLSGHQGPLAGVLSGLEFARAHGHSHIVTVAVDTPFFPCDLVPQLILAGLAHPDTFAVATTSNGVQGTFGLWPVSLTPHLQAFLADGHRKVRAFTDSMNAVQAIFPDTEPDSFFNINTPNDLKTAQQWL